MHADRSHASTRARRGWRRAAAAAVMAAALVVAGIVIVTNPTDTAASVDAPRDLNGSPVALDPGTIPSPEQEAAMQATRDGEGRFSVPSVGLDVPLGALNVVDGAITPPGFDTAYRIRNLGVSPADAAEGTVYVVMHALRGGAVGPGNYLIDVDAGRSRLTDGARVVVGEAAYTVTGSVTIPKDHTGEEAGVWADEPGRLVIITCLQRPDGGPATDNVVITATLIDAAASN